MNIRLATHYEAIATALIVVIASIWSIFYPEVFEAPPVSTLPESSFSEVSDKAIPKEMEVPESSEAVPSMASDHVTLLFGGDMMFDRYIREVGEKKGYDFIFSPIHEKLLSYDGVIANLEGPITTQSSVSVGSEFGSAKNYVFTFDPKVTQTLWDNNIHTVNIGNNHILNFGNEGLSETKRLLTQSHIEFFGDPSDAAHTTVIRTVRDIRIAFVNYNQFAAKISAEESVSAIRKAKQQADIVVVYTHWGVEYEAPPQAVKDLAHTMIDEGADVIIGSHPHIVQESEIYKGKKIYYSLGNFVFDQFFQDMTKNGLLVEMQVNTNDKSLSFQDIAISLETNGQVRLMR